jgi:hypothetical protein
MQGETNMRLRTTITLRRTGLLLLVSFLAGCASGPRIVANSAPDFNLADFRTFGFLQPLSTDQGNVRTINSTHLIEAATREMEMAGLRRADNNPDLLVNFLIATRETISSRPSTSASMHHSRGRYNTWRGYSMSMSTTQIVQRTEGTLAVDIIDRSANQLVWEGAASGRVTDSTRRNIEETLDNAIMDIFAEFP